MDIRDECALQAVKNVYGGSIKLRSGVNGSITIKSTDGQLSISAGQKTSELLTPLVELYGGYVYIDRGGNGSFK
ncbi:hypothetical protein E4U54_005201 [Claviceps lovelessii]|nr:hypothetical protein E4U54_005201 [Claviceps lovelessii]